MEEVVKRTGFKFDASGAGPTQEASSRERDALRELDPDFAFENEAAIKAA
jgi:glutaconate CoA-transferase subunit B